MGSEQELKKVSSLHKEFQNLLDKDFKDRKLKENEIIKATVTEITKNFIIVDCKAKMEGMIPIEEFKNDDELKNLKVGSQIDVYLERIESFKGEIIISRDKARKMKAWKKMEKVFETQEEMTGYITGKVKGGCKKVCDKDGKAASDDVADVVTDAMDELLPEVNTTMLVDDGIEFVTGRVENEEDVADVLEDVVEVVGEACDGVREDAVEGWRGGRGHL